MPKFMFDPSLKEFKQITIGLRYNRDPRSAEFFYQLTSDTVTGWINDDLSREAMTLLLIFSSHIKENYPWNVKWGQFRSPIFPSEDELQRAYSELISKGYAVKDGDTVYLRNDKRVDFPNGLTPKYSPYYKYDEEDYTPQALSDFEEMERQKDLTYKANVDIVASELLKNERGY